MRILVTGSGGFLGGHLVKKLIDQGFEVRAVDIKPLDEWFQVHKESENIDKSNLRLKDNCDKVSKSIDLIFNLACDHGGIGHIMNNHFECMRDVLINSHLIDSAVENNVSKYLYTSSACVYNTNLQLDAENEIKLKEQDAYPALPDSQYGWEKLYSEMVCKQYMIKHGIKIFLPRIHGCYGTHNHFNDGKEKAPNALTRKSLEAIKNGDMNINIWGDGNQRRSFMYFEDCINGLIKLSESNFHEPINLGSSASVSINDCVDALERLLKTKFNRIYDKSATQGVRSRNSDNTLIKKILNWEPDLDIDYGFGNLIEHIKPKI
jgi:GDP-D-mannose 3',5'-epimerase